MTDYFVLATLDWGDHPAPLGAAMKINEALADSDYSVISAPRLTSDAEKWQLVLEMEED